MSASAPKKKCLIALDFDHSVIEDNSDMYIQQLAPGGKIPAEIEKLYRSDGWTEYMGAIFKYLHEAGIKGSQINEFMKTIPLIDGMPELFQFFKDSDFDVIIISDSNSLFINLILKHYKIDSIVDEVFTNPAQFNEHGCLTIEFYHEQDWCRLSSKNLCKGHILDEYIAKRAKEGVHYDCVGFVGDGGNDYCPMLRLRSQDLAFVRKSFSLHRLLKDKPEQEIKAKVIMWDNGKDILESLKQKS